MWGLPAPQIISILLSLLFDFLHFLRDYHGRFKNGVRPPSSKFKIIYSKTSTNQNGSLLSRSYTCVSIIIKAPGLAGVSDEATNI